MSLVIFGAMGNIGRRLMAGLPDTIGVDRIVGADLVADLSSIDYGASEIRDVLQGAEGLVHVATSANVSDPDAVHWQAVVDTARLLAACDRHDVPRVVIPSSDWADPRTRWALHEQNAYGRSKRVFEEMAHMYNMRPGRHCVALRFGWVPRDQSEVGAAEQWLQANYWDDARVIAQVRAALGI